MSSTQVGAVLRHIRKLAAARKCVVFFHVEGPNIASTGLGPVMTRTAETFADPQGRRTCGATFDHPALASRPVPACARGW
jgi:hypothetical protein